MKPAPLLDLSSLRVLDGGMATELERRGCDISGPLWSAHVLDAAPGIVKAVHLDYLRAGADCISTVSYQVSNLGYAELGRGPADAIRALQQSVTIAVEARDEYRRESGRSAQGVRLLNLEPGDRVAAAVVIPPDEAANGNGTLLQ